MSLYIRGYLMEFEDILEFESDLKSKHSDLVSAKDNFKTLASDERKLKRLRSKLLALDVDVSNIDNALASLTALHNAANKGYKSVIADLYEFVGYDGYTRALDQGHKLACYARSVQLDKKKAGIGTLTRGENAKIASSLFVISRADFKLMIKKKLKILKKVRAKLSPIRYDTVKTRNEWLILKLELKLLRRACKIASLRLENNAPVQSAGKFDMRISYVMNNKVATEPDKKERKFYFSERPYVEANHDVKPFTKQPLQKLHRQFSNEDLLNSEVNKTNGSNLMPRTPNR